MPYLEIDGRNCFYTGNPSREGSPILFCHGSGGGHHHWVYQSKKLPKNINPIAVDLPGHGRSEGLPYDKIDAYRDWLHRFSEAIGLTKFVVAGHSMGGAVAMTYALTYPEYTAGLILVGTGAKLRVLPAFLEELRRGHIPEELPNYLYSPGAPEELVKRGKEEVEKTDPSIFLADLSACDNFNIMDELERIEQPALIICGSEDQLTPVKYSRLLEEKIFRGKLEIIEGAGHMVILEKPDEVNRAITNFIEEAI